MTPEQIREREKSKQINYTLPLITDDLIRMGHQWEYFSCKFIDAASDEALNILGKERWELVTVVNGLYHFKRKLLP